MVNWEKREITGISGTIYRIEPSNISVGRFAEYEVLSLMLGFNSDFKTFYTTLNEISHELGQVKILGDVINLKEKVNQLIAAVGNYVENSAPKIIRFCSLFCNEAGEDVSTFTNEQVKKKFDDWAHLPIADFFLLGSSVIPYLQEAYKIEVKKKT